MYHNSNYIGHSTKGDLNTTFVFGSHIINVFSMLASVVATQLLLCN